MNKDDIERIEKKLDRLLEIFAVASKPQRSKKQLDEIASKSVVDFLERHKAKEKHGNQENK